jgi:hypothetical protein
MISVRYRLIEKGRVLGEQVKEYDHTAMASKAMEEDAFAGMDIAEQIRRGESVKWIEARRITRPETADTAAGGGHD